MDHLRTHVCRQIARGRSHFDRLLNARVGHAPTQISAHRGINNRIMGVAVLLQQTCRLHDLPRLAVATLWCLRRYPSLLQRMLTRSAQTLNGGIRRIRNTAYQDDAGTLCYAVNMYGADSAHANTATDLVPLRPSLSRTAQSSGVWSGMSRETERPFIFSDTGIYYSPVNPLSQCFIL